MPKVALQLHSDFFLSPSQSRRFFGTYCSWNLSVLLWKPGDALILLLAQRGRWPDGMPWSLVDCVMASRARQPSGPFFTCLDAFVCYQKRHSLKIHRNHNLLEGPVLMFFFLPRPRNLLSTSSHSLLPWGTRTCHLCSTWSYAHCLCLSLTCSSLVSHLSFRQCPPILRSSDSVLLPLADPVPQDDLPCLSVTSHHLPCPSDHGSHEATSLFLNSL